MNDGLVSCSEKLYIRADMNATVASGHVMRCLSIAEAARELGIKTVFIVADDNPVELIESKGYETIVLNSAWNDLNSELPVLMQLIEEKDIKRLLVDSYYVTDYYLSELSAVTTVAYMDDLNEGVYPSKILIAYDACWDEEEYRIKHSKSKVFYGYNFIPLRREFQKIENRHASTEAKKLLILSGGGDTLHMVKRILKMGFIDKFESVTAICGSLNPDYEYLSEEYGDSEKISVVHMAEKISEYMKEADICISASGNTLYELCATGTPTIAYAVNETQESAPRKLMQNGTIEYVGMATEDSFDHRLEETVEKLATDYKKRKSLTAVSQSIVDGQGAFRIAKAVMDYE